MISYIHTYIHTFIYIFSPFSFFFFLIDNKFRKQCQRVCNICTQEVYSDSTENNTKGTEIIYTSGCLPANGASGERKLDHHFKFHFSNSPSHRDMTRQYITTYVGVDIMQKFPFSSQERKIKRTMISYDASQVDFTFKQSFPWMLKCSLTISAPL